MNRGEEEMLQLMGTDDSFRSIASWLSDNIVSMQEKMYGFFGYVLYSSTGRNGCHLSLFFHFQVSSHERNCKNNTVGNVLRTMEFLRIYICRENLLPDVAVRGNLQPWTDQGSCDLPI